MANSLLSNIINTGFHDDLPTHLKRKVQTTNVITLLIAFVIGIPFVGISLIYFPFLAIFPGLGVFICFGILLTNHLGGIYYSRIVLALLPVTLGAMYNAYLSGPQDGPIPSIYLIELSFALIPFVIFDLREKGFLFFTTFCCALIILTFPV